MGRPETSLMPLRGSSDGNFRVLFVVQEVGGALELDIDKGEKAGVAPFHLSHQLLCSR